MAAVFLAVFLRTINALERQVLDSITDGRPPDATHLFVDLLRSTTQDSTLAVREWSGYYLLLCTIASNNPNNSAADVLVKARVGSIVRFFPGYNGWKELE